LIALVAGEAANAMEHVGDGVVISRTMAVLKGIFGANNVPDVSCVLGFSICSCKPVVLGRLFIKVPRPGDSEVTFSASSQAATCYYQFNHSKGRGNSLCAFP